MFKMILLNECPECPDCLIHPSFSRLLLHVTDGSRVSPGDEWRPGPKLPSEQRWDIQFIYICVA